MRNKIYTIIAALALVIGAGACSDDNWNPKVEKDGSVDLGSLTLDISTAENLVNSRASYDTSNFIIDILSGGSVVETWTYSAMPEIITLPVGEYTLSVRSHEVQKQEWDNPYFVGSKVFTIENNKVTQIGTVVCKFSNIKVDIVFGDDLLEHVDGECKVTVVANDDGVLDFVPTEKRSGFFAALESSNTLVATLNAEMDGATVTVSTPYTNVAPGTHYVITYTLKNTEYEIDETGTLEIAGGISVTTSVEDVNLGGSVGVEDEVIETPERPGTEQPENPEDPTDPGEDPGEEVSTITFTSETLDFDTENSVNVESAVVKLHSDYGFQHLYVTISSDNQNFLDSAGELMPLSFDLANAGDYAAAFKSIGLPVGPFSESKTDLDFDITALVPLLGGFPGHHSFYLNVVDFNDAQKSLTLKFKAE